MKPRLILFRRNGVFYCEDSETGKQTTLRTRERSEAVAIVSVDTALLKRQTPPRTTVGILKIGISRDQKEMVVELIP